MATNLLSDELKSGMTYIKPPITKEIIVKEVNALIYHFKEFGVCYESDIVYPSGSNYLASTTPQTIVIQNHGQAAEDFINKLNYLYIPVELNDITYQINLIIDILKSGTITSSYYAEHLKNDIYIHSSDIAARNSFSNLNYGNDLGTKISALQKISLPVSYYDLINEINTIISLFKINSRIIDASDFRLMIYALKAEKASVEGSRDFGHASSTGSTVNYGEARTTPEEFQSNDFELLNS